MAQPRSRANSLTPDVIDEVCRLRFVYKDHLVTNCHTALLKLEDTVSKGANGDEACGEFQVTLEQLEQAIYCADKVIAMNMREGESVDEQRALDEESNNILVRDIDQLRDNLEVCKTERLQKEEYDALMRIIHTIPPRVESDRRIAELDKELETLDQELAQVQSQAEVRSKQFALLFSALNQLQAELSAGEGSAQMDTGVHRSNNVEMRLEEEVDAAANAEASRAHIRSSTPSLSTGVRPGESYEEAIVREAREQERLLPVANIARIMKRALPSNAKIAREAKELLQVCVSEFIGFLTSEATDNLKHERRKTVTSQDVLNAMRALGFDPYIPALERYLENRAQALGTIKGGARRGRKRSSVSSSRSPSSSPERH